MNLFISDFFESRIEKITENLLETNGEYALSVEKCKELFRNIEPIITHEGDLTICDSDCLDFQEYLEHQSTRFTIMQQEVYRQGYLDCVKLLGTLGVF